MTLIAGDVGGSFGMKGGLYCEVPLVAWARKRVGRPVKWTCERSEALSPTTRRATWRSTPSSASTRTASSSPCASPSNNNVGAYLTMLGFISTAGITHAPYGVYATPAVHGRAAGGADQHRAGLELPRAGRRAGHLCAGAPDRHGGARDRSSTRPRSAAAT